MLDRASNPTAARANNRYTLSLFRGLFDQKGQAQNATDRTGMMTVVSNYNHRLQQVRKTDHGSDRLVVTLYAESRQDIGNLARWFNTWLGTDLQMTVGGQRIWRGLCRKMTLWAGGSARVVDLASMANVVRVTHAGEGEEESTSDFVSEESVLRFGRKELLIDAPEMNSADAARMANERLEWLQWPRTQPLAFGGTRAQLTCEFVGYHYLFTWLRRVLTGGMSTQDMLKTIIDEFGQGVITFAPGSTSIGDNGQQWDSDLDTYGRRALDLVTAQLDSDQRLWNWWIDYDLVFHFEKIDFRPRYWLRHGQTSSAIGTYEGASGSKLADAWQIEPGFVRRDTTWPVFNAQADNRPYLSEQDEYIEAVSYDEYGNPSLEPRQIDHGDALVQFARIAI